MAFAPIALSTIAAGTGGFVLNGELALDHSGISVAFAGDVNGDGIADIIVGADGADPNGQASAGKSYVVFGRSNGSTTAIELSDIALGSGGFVMNGTVSFDRSGRAVASAGDVNGDGVADVIVGAYVAAAGGKSQAGRSYVVFGQTAPSGGSVALSNVAAGTGGFVINGQNAYDRSGRAVASAGDINGDGFDDIVIGAREADPGNYNGGRAYVVFGRSTSFGAAINLSAIAQGSGGFVVNGRCNVDYTGGSVSSAGDVNGDGLDDLFIGADRSDLGGSTDGGTGYVVFGRTGGFGASISLSSIAAGTGGFAIVAQFANEFVGRSVSSAGDFDGDGVADLIIGADRAQAGLFPRSGKSFVVFGKTTGFGATVDLSAVTLGTGGFFLAGAAAFDYSGFSVSSAGDFNGDGFDDLLVGAHYADPSLGQSDAGKTYVVFGRSDRPTSPGPFEVKIELSDIAAGTGGFVLDGEGLGDASGKSVSGAGDVNGDGFDDLLVGAYLADPTVGRENAGKTYVILGRDMAGTVTHAGSTASETLTGSAAADDMVGGLGDDILDGQGGADVLIGGAGNDTLKVADLAFRRLSGGTGTDTMAVTGAGITLNLATVSNTRIQDIEVIDLTGAGDNTLVVSRQEALSLSGTSNTLRVEGNAGDVVITDLENWTKGASSGGYKTYTNGQATLLVDHEVGVACFVAGTRITTPDGMVAVETLRPGDLVRTAAGGVRPVRWIGFRHLDLMRHPRPQEACPILIRAQALGPGVPVRDLMVSGEHAMLVQGALVPARLLVNGGSVQRQAGVRRVTYYHVELDSHDILLAEGAPAESYLDTGNRNLFENAGLPLRLHPAFSDDQALRVGRSCAPLHDQPAQVEPIWRDLAARSWALGFALPEPPATTAEPGLRIEVDGRVLAPLDRRTDGAVFLLPPCDGVARLVSRATAPSALRGWVADTRPLGVQVRRIRLRQGGMVTDLPLDGPGLLRGWWQPEGSGHDRWRWTDGAAELLITTDRPALLEVTFGMLDAYILPIAGRDPAGAGPAGAEADATGRDHPVTAAPRALVA